MKFLKGFRSGIHNLGYIHRITSLRLNKDKMGISKMLDRYLEVLVDEEEDV